MLDLNVQLQRGDLALNVAAQLDQRVTGLFGRSGAGKTTLLHLIAGLVAPQRGRIALNGRTLFDRDAGIDLPPHQRRVGVVFQDARLFPHYTVEGNLTYGLGLTHAGQRRFEFDPIVDLLELRPLLRRRPRGLSGGEIRRVALGRALLASPELLLMDEPLAALDQALKKQIMPFLERVRDQVRIPMIYVSHDLPEVLRLTGHLLVLERGQVSGCGDFAALRLTDRVLDAVHHLGLVNVLKLTVLRHEPDGGISLLRVSDTQHFRAPLIDAEPGRTVNVAIRPEDVALAAAPVAMISIQNQLRGIVRRLIRHQGSTLVEVDVGQPLLVEISYKAAADLALAEGREIWCLVKTRAMTYL